MIIHKLVGEIPEDLPPGIYAAPIQSAEWDGDDLVITCKYEPGLDSSESLLKIVKE